MSDRIEREIDELLEQLGFADTVREAPPPGTRSRRDWRRYLPGSPPRLMLLSLVLLATTLVLHAALIRPLIYLSVGLLALGYATWLFEPDEAVPTDRLGKLGRLYRWLYGEK